MQSSGDDGVPLLLADDCDHLGDRAGGQHEGGGLLTSRDVDGRQLCVRVAPNTSVLRYSRIVGTE